MSFGYAGPLSSAVFVAGAFNDATTNAKAFSENSKTTFDQASTFLDTYPATPNSDQVIAGDYAALATRVVEAKNFDDRANYEFGAGLQPRDQLSSTVNGPLRAFQDKMTTDMASFYTTYFPNSPAAFTSAVQQVQDGIRYGGSTVRRSVSDMKWSQEVDLLLRKRADDEEAIIAKFSARKYPTPAGGMMRELCALNELTQRLIAESSNKLALAQFDAEAERTRAYIDMAQKNRVAAMDAFGEYMLSIVSLRYDQMTAEGKEQEGARRRLRELFLRDKLAERDAELWTRKTTMKQYELAITAFNDTDAFVKKQIEVLFEAAISQATRLSTIAATAFNVMRGGAAMTSTETG